MIADLVDLGASRLAEDTNVPLLQAKGPPISDDGDAPDYGDVPVFSCLGVTALPYQATADGNAQGVVVKVDGFDGVLIGARDTRTAGIVGNLKPGDTAVHSTGPSQAAQLLLKEEKRQAVLMTKDSKKKSAVLLLDGKNDKVQIAAFGCLFEISRENGICLVGEHGKASIQIVGDTIVLRGKILLGGAAPTGAVMVMGPTGPMPIPNVFA